jgi:hypothetical protein
MPIHGPTATVAEEATRRAGCSVEGCACKDVRIVLRRRAAFFAAEARRNGQTADRVIAAETGWRIPAPVVAEPDAALD